VHEELTLLRIRGLLDSIASIAPAGHKNEHQNLGEIMASAETKNINPAMK
jgi:hypothetical protein